MDNEWVRAVVSLWNKRSIRYWLYVVAGVVAMALVVRDGNNIYNENRIAVNNFEMLNCRDLRVHVDAHTRNNIRSDCERLHGIMTRGIAAALISRLFNTIFLSGAEIVIGVVLEFNTTLITVGVFVALAMAVRLVNQYFTAHTQPVQLIMPPWTMPPPQNYGSYGHSGPPNSVASYPRLPYETGEHIATRRHGTHDSEGTRGTHYDDSVD